MCPSPNHVELSVNRHLPAKEKKKKKKSILYNKLKPNKNWISSLREKLAARYE